MTQKLPSPYVSPALCSVQHPRSLSEQIVQSVSKKQVKTLTYYCWYFKNERNLHVDVKPRQ